VKILLINQTFYPDIVATAQHLTDFAVDLAKRGHDVTVLAWQRGYAEPHPLYPAKEIYQGVKIVRVWPFAFGKKSKIARIIDAFFLNLSFAWKLLWLGRFDKVIAMTSPPLVGWIALLFSKCWKSKFIYWVMDINPDEAIELGWIKRGSFQAVVLEKALRAILKQSDYIVVLDRFMKDRLAAKGAREEKIRVISPWSHDDDLESILHEQNPFRERHGLRDKFVVMYSGNHSVCHPLDTLLEAALLLRKDPNVVFMFIGGGVRVKDVLEFKEKNSLPNIIYLPYQPRSEVKYSLSAADLHAVVMGDAFVGIVHPCKIYGILKIGRPFVYIGPKQSHIGDLIKKDVGYHVQHGDAVGLAEIIEKASMLATDQKTAIQKTEQSLAPQFSHDFLVPQFLQAITSL